MQTPKPVVRIETPSWAEEPEVWLDSIKLSQYEEIRDQHRVSLLSLVDESVRTYLSDTDLVFGAEDPDQGFPSWGRLTGEYYLGDESYTGKVGPVGIQVSVQTHFLEHRSHPHQESLDYLGLEVWLWFDPLSSSLCINRDADSSSI